MILVQQPLAPDRPFTVVLRPNQSLSRPATVLVVAAMVVTTLGLAGIAAWQGNLFAPVFAVLHLAIVCGGLALAWRGGLREERISLGDESVEVEGDAGRAQRFPRPWVRLAWLPGDRATCPRRLMLAAHGRQVEIGAFLAEHEREQLALRMASLLARSGRQAQA
jgi:uncharacterized membrane protein